MRRALAVLALVTCACGGSGKAPAGKPNLVLVTLDTTRADHLGCYGDARAATPNIDRIAAEGALFEQAIAVAPLTLPSHASLMTGLYPPRHGVRDNADFRLPDRETTLAEQLHGQGYKTAASVGTYILSSVSGLGKGFDSYDQPKLRPRIAGGESSVLYEPIVERPAAEVVNDALASIERMKDGPFFLWIHLYDPHEPYTPPPPFRERFASAPYDGEIASADAELGRVFEMLRSGGLMDRTIIAITADHGESLGEHGEDTHGLFVYDSTLHVPLILRAAGRIKAGTRYPGLVSGVDLTPTLLDLLGAPPIPAAEGRSVAPALGGGRMDERAPVYAESLYGERAYGWAPLHALRSAREKYIDAPEAERYDLARDPAESTNLASSGDGGWGERLIDAVKAMGPADPSAVAMMPGEQRDRIASLGYVSAGAPGLARRDRPDPKKLITVSNLYQQAQQAVGRGDRAYASQLLTRALAKDPDNPAAASLMGSLRFAQDAKGAIAQLRAAAAASPDNFEYQWNLGNALFVDRQYEAAATAYRAASAIRPASGDVHYALGNVLAAGGDLAGAIAEYNVAVKRGLRTPPVIAALGTAEIANGDAAGGEKHLRAALEADPKLADGWNQLGVFLDRTGRRDEAESAFSKALAVQPDHADALFNRAKLELMAKRTPDARRDVDALLRAHPDYAPARFIEAHVCAAEGNPEKAREAIQAFLSLPGTDPRMRDAAERLKSKLTP
ncbi:MAG TPA: sulfatase-like hydrolase/transferase [Candidatus Polarisedimenticolaceae bacterium]|nr:sulfatase-like hydrolase/transferase [Candidatus Polarisedimenticolaceae bacterium]